MIIRKISFLVPPKSPGIEIQILFSKMIFLSFQHLITRGVKIPIFKGIDVFSLTPISDLIITERSIKTLETRDPSLHFDKSSPMIEIDHHTFYSSPLLILASQQDALDDH